TQRTQRRNISLVFSVFSVVSSSLQLHIVSQPIRFRGTLPVRGSVGMEALRIQAAALVAQQSALFDRELRLQDREVALARQEQQLAGHLEDKRRQLLELQD